MTKEQFLKLYNRYDKELKLAYAKLKRGEDTFKESEDVIKKHLGRLRQVLHSGSQTPSINATPMLDFWVGNEARLSNKPLPGEQALFDSLISYLCRYYKVEAREDLVDVLQRQALEDTTNVLKNETFYEISQAFNAFGHTSVGESMTKERLEKLHRYADDHVFKPDMNILWEVVKFCANDAAQSSIVIDKISYKDPITNPFQEKGDRNVGSPYWMKTNVKLENRTVNQAVYELAQDLYNRYASKADFNLKSVALPATMFGRNSTKGVETKFSKGKFVILNYLASPRVIYGVSLVNNINIARLYFGVLKHSMTLPEFSTLKGVPHLREILPKLNNFDIQEKVVRISTDKSRYDTTIGHQLMIICAIIDMLAFGHTEKSRRIIELSLYTDALNPILYTQNGGRTIDVLYTLGGHKSGFYNTLLWGSRIGKILYVYSMFILAKDWFLEKYRKYRINHIPFMMFQGDDWSTAYPSMEVALQAMKIEEEVFGMISNIKKSAYGTWIVQMGANHLGKVSFPLARALRSFYYPERSSRDKPPFVLLMTTYSMVELLWDSPHLPYFIKEHVLKADKFKGGHEWFKGADTKTKMKINFDQFYKIFAKQATDYGANRLFNANDPRWGHILDSEGKVQSEWLRKIWTKIGSFIV